uniref:Uncharacterized protein n=1 Tax=Nelumbo nucifera TaxID=4432 RepID=A0A822YIE9_NELNU|nr:TPA_asm: hypothetical protein HUJ06_011113 [Nelumbo nucifera]
MSNFSFSNQAHIMRQQKQESNDAHAEFQWGLEELMHRHLDDCMSLTSCCSTQDQEEVSSLRVKRRVKRSPLSLFQSRLKRKEIRGVGRKNGQMI